MSDDKTRIGACLCFLNFLPLWAAMVLIDIKSLYEQGWGWEGGGAEWCALGGIVVGSIAAVVNVERWIREITRSGVPNRQRFQLQGIQAQKTLTAEVLMTYVLPLFAFKFTEWLGLTEFLLFFAVVVWLAARHRVLSGSLYWELRGFYSYDIALSKGDGKEGKIEHVWSREEMDGEEGAEWEMGQLNNQTYYAVRQLSPGS